MAYHNVQTVIAKGESQNDLPQDNPFFVLLYFGCKDANYFTVNPDKILA